MLEERLLCVITCWIANRYPNVVTLYVLLIPTEMAAIPTHTDSTPKLLDVVQYSLKVKT